MKDGDLVRIPLDEQFGDHDGDDAGNGRDAGERIACIDDGERDGEGEDKVCGGEGDVHRIEHKTDAHEEEGDRVDLSRLGNAFRPHDQKIGCDT